MIYTYTRVRAQRAATYLTTLYCIFLSKQKNEICRRRRFALCAISHDAFRTKFAGVCVVPIHSHQLLDDT